MIYIAGKITGLPLPEVDAKFQEAENRLHAIGVKVINPRKLGISVTWPWASQMAVCLKVIEDRVTGILLLADWIYSDGAKMEFQKVAELNAKRNFRAVGPFIKIYYEDHRGFSTIESDVRDGILNCVIPERL